MYDTLVNVFQRKYTAMKGSKMCQVTDISCCVTFSANYYLKRHITCLTDNFLLSLSDEREVHEAIA